MHGLLEEATGEAYAVLHLIYGQFEETGEWPLWQYVAGKLDPTGTGKTRRAVESMPRVSGGQTGFGYGWLWWDGFIRAKVPFDYQPVQITVAGMWATRLDMLPRLYVGLLRLCNERHAARELLPTQLVTATVTSDDMRKALSAEGTDYGTVLRKLDRLRQIAEQEWPTFGRITERDLSKGYWEVSVPDHITRYAGVETVEGYLIRRIEEIEPPQAPVPAPVPQAPSTPAPPTLQQRFAAVAQRDDHRGHFVAAWGVVAVILVAIDTRVAGRSSLGLVLGVLLGVAALGAAYLMVAAVLHLPPHRS